MKFFQRLKPRGTKEAVEEFELGPLKFRRSSEIERDPDAKIEEYWIEAIDSSDDGFWTLVGRRYGVFQLYDWRGKLHRLPARPPSQSVTDIVFSGRFLGISASPYLAIYYLNTPKDPSSWKTNRISQEGLRPTGGLDIRGGTLAFGVVGEKVYTIDLAGDLSQETVDFKSTFTYRDSRIGDLKAIRILPSGRLVLSGTEGIALYSLGGNLLKKLPVPSGKAIEVFEETLILADNLEGKLLLYDPVGDQFVKEIELPHAVSSISLSQEGRFLFSADQEENRLGVFDLREGAFLGFLEGFGYSVVKVSPDGSIYTSRFEDLEDKRFYYLEKLETNLIGFLYPQSRQKQIIKNAQKLLKAVVKKAKSASDEEELENIPELKELDSLDIPLKEVRQLALKARETVEDRSHQIAVSKFRERIRSKTLSGDDFKKLEERLERTNGKWREAIENLLAEAKIFFEKELGRKLGDVKRALAKNSSTDLRDLEALEEVKEARRFISNLPREMHTEALHKLVKTLQEKVIEERLRIFSIRVEEDRVYFGRESFPRKRYIPPKLRWSTKVEEKVLEEGVVYGKLVFEREDGLVVEPKRFNNILKQEELRHFPPWVSRYLRHLNGLMGRAPAPLSETVAYEETPWFVQNLERFASLVKEQLMYGEGILILEGDAGVGKNFLVEVFSALTGRPLFIVPCNSKMEKEDITFVYEFDPRRGTKRVYSDLVKALKTPGAVIYLDEINTLPPSLVKIFNPLFDYRRYLVLSYGEKIRASEDVIILGGMNPQNYLGVSELPQDIKSRSDVMFVDYPPFQDDRGFYYPDEGIILKDYIPELSDLGREDFTYLWYYLVNEVETERGKELATSERKRAVELLFDLLKIASEIRKAYRLYQTQQSEEPVEFVFSIRDTIRCARRLNKFGDARKAVSETIIPKISSPLEREIVKSIIERV
jgi:MoxR-like ATPase